jgi:hypothetical protein
VVKEPDKLFTAGLTLILCLKDKFVPQKWQI